MAKAPEVKVKVPPLSAVKAAPAYRPAYTQTTRMGNIGFDPRFDERAKEQVRLNNLTTQVEKDPSYEIPKIHLPDYEGSGFVSTMADRTAGGGSLIDINGVSLKRPVGLQAGQSYMFENPGQVWASGDVPVRAIMMQAAAAKALTGKDPLFFGHRMAPTGSDFATMTGETMLSYAESNMGRDTKKALNGRIKEFIPDWKGVDSPKSIDQFRSQPDAVRKAIHAMMDKDFRNEGGLGIGEARLSIADPEQLNAPVGYLMNVGKIFADQPLLQQSGHASYPRGVPGEGIGRVGDERSLFELYPKTFPEEGKEKVIRPLLLDPATALTEYNNLPNVVESRNIADPKTPSFNDTRALQMKPYYGILTEEILRKMGYAHGGVVHKAEGGMVDSLPEEAIKNTIKDPQAFNMLDMDLARLALLNQQRPQAPRHMADGGILDGHPVFQTAQVPFAEYRHSIGMNQGGVNMAGGGRPPLRSLDEVPSDEYLTAELARINAAPTVRANSADETANYARYVAERAGQPIEMPARPDYTPGFSVLEKPTYGSEVPGTTPTIDQQRYELTMRGQQDAANKQYRAQQGDALAGMDPTGTLAVTDAARTMGLGMLALPVHAGRSAFHYLQHGNMKDAPTGMDYEEFMSPRTAEGAELLEEVGTAGSRLTGSEMGFGMHPNLWVNGVGVPTVAQMRAGLKLGAERAAPVLSKIDQAVRSGYESGAIPQPGLSIKDVTPKALAPANEQGFYSPTEAAALNLQRKTGNGQAFLNDIMKGENVRPDEIKAMGLDTFLKDKKNVTAAEVQDYIAQNKLGLGESRYGALTKDISESRDAFKAYGQELANKYGIPEGQNISMYAGLKNIPAEEIAKYERLQNEWLDQQPKAAKFSGYQLPGGENYREVVLTLPIENQDALHAAQTKAGDLRRQTGNLMEQWRKLADVSKPGDPAVLEAYQKVADSRNLRDQAEAEADELRKTASNKTYRSSHWDEPNPLAHLRMSDRVTDGKKTLLVDEVQSDWHQAGRERGYKDPQAQEKIEQIKTLKDEMGALNTRRYELYAQAKETTDGDLPQFIKLTEESNGITNKMLELNKQINDLEHFKRTQEGAIPNAPYKEDWYQLALRRAVKEAIDGGYDRVALPTGARVNERFSLSKQIDSMIYAKEADGTYSLSASKGGSEVAKKDNLSESELSAFVGKDMAKKMIEGEGKSIGMNEREFTGLDLDVGGGGNKKYYDEIYPGYLKKFGKKYGASVGKTTVDADGVAEPLHYMDITPAMRKEFSTGIHMKKGGKVSFANSLDAMRHELTKAK